MNNLPDDPNYIGNMNFLKSSLGQVVRFKRNLEISLTDCEAVEMEVNVAEITYKQIDIKIVNTSSVIINTIRNSNILEFAIIFSQTYFFYNSSTLNNFLHFFI
jgi:hypothetical protein